MATSKIDRAAFALLSEYSALYKKRYGSSPVVNKYKEKWAMISLVEDFSSEGVVDTLEYYFRLNKDGHPLNWFYNNFSTLYNSRLAAEKDAKIREETRKRTQELRVEYLNDVS